MGAKRCAECGAELRFRSAPCPLCGQEPDAAKEKPKGDKAVKPVADVAGYQKDLRKLREELKRLREAEAS